MSVEPRIDVQVENHGSLFLFRPLTPEGEAWIKENLRDAEFLGNAAAAEPRYVETVVMGMREDGLIVQ